MPASTTPPEPAKPARPPKPRKGSEVELTLDRLTYGGRALGRLDGYVVFVPHGAPGDRVRVRLDKTKSGFGEATLLEVLSPASERITPRCNLFTRCGGCSWQHLPPATQEHWKSEIIREALHPLKAVQAEPIELDSIVSSPDAYGYRNKMEFTFGREGDGAPLKLGFHAPGNWRSILDVDACHLHPGCFNDLLRVAREEGERQRASAWSPVRHEGTLRHLVVRWSVFEQRALVAILTGTRDGFDFAAFRDVVIKTCPWVKGLVWGVNSARSDVARAEEVLATWGEDMLEEHLGSLKFRISLQSFFQTNTRGAEKLYEVAREYLELSGNEQVLDAYCGTGTIGLFCAAQAKHIYGIELIREAIWDARINAEANGFANTTFVAGDMADALPHLVASIPGAVDRLVVDPPRGGMERRALDRLVALGAPVLVYVSCNPTTMARDLQVMIEGGYQVERVRPVDMFPQTYHIECVARCVRRF